MLRIGLIGTGGISGVHLRYLKSRPDVHIVGAPFELYSDIGRAFAAAANALLVRALSSILSIPSFPSIPIP